MHYRITVIPHDRTTQSAINNKEYIMLESLRANANAARANVNAAAVDGNLNDASTDVKALVKDAQSLLTAAAALTGTKADELRERGMAMLDTALGKANKVQGQAVVKGKELAHTADVYVKDNPWRTVAVAAGVGVLLGVLLGRK
jgi:ElaB/YqjD/DUF883 family membrane-anchored ribosome-binding protein